jgi:hypothetical protein
LASAGILQKMEDDSKGTIFDKGTVVSMGRAVDYTSTTPITEDTYKMLLPSFWD